MLVSNFKEMSFFYYLNKLPKQYSVLFAVCEVKMKITHARFGSIITLLGISRVTFLPLRGVTY